MTTTLAAISPLVIKIGGAGVDDPHAQAPLWRAVLEAHRILQGHLVLVHGGGRAVDAHLERLGMKTERIEGLRVTPKEQMPEITAVLAGRVNKALVGAINAQGNDTPAVGLSLGDGGTLPAKITRSPDGHDLGRVGRPISGEASLVRLLMAYRYLPVICSIGFDEHGEALNLNADDAAAGLAQALHARTLVLLTDVPAVLDEEKRPIATLSHAESEALIARGTISGGMVPKVRAALNAARNARTPASIASWNRPEDLIRIARGESAGTSVLPT
jgi:acetylglutamate kinase